MLIKTIVADPPEIGISYNLKSILKNNCTWAEVEQHWITTKNFRLAEVVNVDFTAEIFEKWLHYKKPMGFKLVSLNDLFHW